MHYTHTRGERERERERRKYDYYVYKRILRCRKMSSKEKKRRKYVWLKADARNVCAAAVALNIFLYPGQNEFSSAHNIIIVLLFDMDRCRIIIL